MSDWPSGLMAPVLHTGGRRFEPDIRHFFLSTKRKDNVIIRSFVASVIEDQVGMRRICCGSRYFQHLANLHDLTALLLLFSAQTNFPTTKNDLHQLHGRKRRLTVGNSSSLPQ